MSRRTPRQAPQLPGYTFVEPIGAGGYADVYLYEQHMPQRRVAIKVLDTSAAPHGDRAAFTNEANVMAMVSAHPYIVQVFGADIAPDGRPYLVMEYYPGPNYYDRARSERLDVTEVLRVGVQLAAAVETAHRAGILHRDIKPANVLASAYRRPGLTDFGIAAAHGLADAADALSVPWSPPEAFGGSSDRRSDVYSLAATLHTLLTGRSPFEVTGGDNGQLALMARIERNPVPSVARSDVPPSLERVLAGAMAKQPGHRPASAAEFARQLQSIESELHLAVTPLELADSSPGPRLRSGDVDADSTRIKGVTEVAAQTPVTSGPIITSGPGVAATGPGYGNAAIGAIPDNPSAVGAPVGERRREGPLAEPEVADTLYRPTGGGPPLPPPAPPPAGMPKVAVAALAVAALLALVIGAVVVLGQRGDDAKDTSARVDEPVVDDINEDVDLGDIQVVRPIEPDRIAVTANADGTFAFEWPSAGDGYVYEVTAPEQPVPIEVDVPQFLSPVECISVRVLADDGRRSAATAAPACTGG